MRVLAASIPAALALLLLLGACGYRRGNLVHPGLRSIEIGRVHNDSNRPGLEAIAKRKLRNAFVTDGSLRLVDGEPADCRLEARVISWRQESIGARVVRGVDDDSYTSTMWELAVTVQYELRLRGADRPLLPLRRVTGKAEFAELADLETSRREAFSLAMQDAAQQIVVAVTEAW